MKVRYDADADVVYIRFREGEIAESDEIKEGVIIDYDSEGKTLAIELLDAKEIFAGKPEVVIDFAPFTMKAEKYRDAHLTCPTTGSQSASG
ncbi:MAG: DUF2283 domain-containing protein [Elusimicrobiota bacterium]